MSVPQKIVDRFHDTGFTEKHVYPELGPCHVWNGARHPKGFGRMLTRSTRAGKQTCYYAHRVAWELEHGPIPEGMYLYQACWEPACINTGHMYVGGEGEKTRRFQEIHGPGKTVPRRYTPAEVRTMRELHTNGVSYRKLDAMFKGSTQAIVEGRVYRDV